MIVSSGSLLRAISVPSRSENSWSHAVQRSRSMCLCVPVHDRYAMLPSPGRLNRAQCGFGHENRVYLSCAGVVSVIPVLLWQGMDCKILGRRQFRHVTILQDYRFWRKISMSIYLRIHETTLTCLRTCSLPHLPSSKLGQTHYSFNP